MRGVPRLLRSPSKPCAGRISHTNPPPLPHLPSLISRRRERERERETANLHIQRAMHDSLIFQQAFCSKASSQIRGTKPFFSFLFSANNRAINQCKHSMSNKRVWFSPSQGKPHMHRPSRVHTFLRPLCFASRWLFTFVKTKKSEHFQM